MKGDTLVGWMFGLVVWPAVVAIFCIQAYEAKRSPDQILCPVVNGKVSHSVVIEKGRAYCGGYR